MARVPLPGAVLRRRRGGRSRRGAGDGTGAADADAGAVAEIRHAAGRRRPGQPGAQRRRRRRSRRCWTSRSRRPMRCTTWCAARSATRRRSSGRRCASRLIEAARASPTSRWLGISQCAAGPVLRQPSGDRPERQGPRRHAGTSAAPGPQRPGAPRPVCIRQAPLPERTRILTAILLRHPVFAERRRPRVSTPCRWIRPLTRLRDAIEAWAETAETLDSAGLMDHLTKSGFEHDVQHVLAGAPMPLPACAASERDAGRGGGGVVAHFWLSQRGTSARGSRFGPRQTPPGT